LPWTCHFQIWQYHDKLKMTRAEVKKEGKELEGNPEVKSRIRQLQREAARKRMMSAVPAADVIVTNPSHYAVALAYKQRHGGAETAGQGDGRGGAQDTPDRRREWRFRWSRLRSWRARCIVTANSTRRFLRPSTRRSPRCWPTSTS
jgi:hypothetical protein